MFLLFLPLFGALVGVGAYVELLVKTETDTLFINAAGRQRMLAMEIRAWADMVASGQDEDRAGLRERVDEFERVLAVLNAGGQMMGRNLRPAPREIQDELDEVARLWAEIKPDLSLIADAPSGDPRVSKALEAVQRQAFALRDAADAVVTAYEARSSRLHARTLYSLVGVAFFLIVLLAAGYWALRRYVLRPILEVDRASRQLLGGGIHPLAKVTTADVLSAPTAAFETMATEIRRLLGLLDGQRRYAENIINSVPSGIAVLRRDFTVIRANQSFREQFARDADTLSGRPLADFFESAEVTDMVRRTADTGQTRRGLQTDLLTRDRVLHPARVAASGIRIAEEEEEEEEEALLLTVEDLTEEDRLRAHARALEARFQEVFETATDGLVLMDKDGLISYFNASAERMFGWRRGEVIGKPVTILMPEKYREAHRQGVNRFLQTGQASVMGRAIEIEALRKNGSVLPIEVTISSYRTNGDVVFTGVIRDVTERKQLAGRMMQMDRLIAMGTLAAGVAHEINNPLAYVTLNLDMVSSELPGMIMDLRQREENQGVPLEGLMKRLMEVHSLLGQAREGAARVQKIVRDLKGFSRAEEDVRESVSIQTVMESAISMAWNEMRHRAKLVKDYTAIPVVSANEARLGQVFLNLLVNAAHAIPDGHAEENEIRVILRTDGQGRAVVEVRDTGCGIPPENMSRIFDPFFTTKSAGQGTGLGLSICHNIVHEIGGEISVENERGNGAVFRVVLPPADSACPPSAGEIPPSLADVAAPEAKAPAKRGRILIVDDEPLIARSLAQALARAHDTVAVTSATEALNRLAVGEQYDLVLCDLMMPQMSGVDFYEEVSLKYPSCAKRIIFLTGGVFSPQVSEFLARIPNPCIEKPFNLKALMATIRERIDS